MNFLSNKVKDTLLRMFAWVANFVIEKDANNSKKKRKKGKETTSDRKVRKFEKFDLSSITKTLRIFLLC